MAHIVCVTEGLAGLLYSSFELARRLEAAGHELTYLTRRDAAAPAEAQGLAYRRVPRPSKAPSQDAGWLQRVWSVRARRQRAADALGGQAFAAMLRELDPDLLLVDVELHAYIITAVPMGIPTALLSPFFSLWKRPGMPPLHRAIVPGQGWYGHRLGVEWAWLRFRIGKGLRRRRRWLRTGGVDAVAVHRHLARQTGFPFEEEVACYHWPIPFTYRTLPVLCLNAREMEFPHDPRPALHFVGPMVHRERRDVRAGTDVRDRLQALHGGRRPEDSGRPLVLVSCSTFKTTSPAFLGRVLRAAAQRPEWDVVLSLGGRSAVDDLGALPENVHAFPWIPILEVLPHTSAVVTNAGINTINECICFGVPSVVYSLRTNDQNGTAARVAYHGVGVVGDLDDPAEKIAAQVERALTHPGIRRRLDRMQEQFRAYEAEQRALRVVERMLERGPAAGPHGLDALKEGPRAGARGAIG